MIMSWTKKRKCLHLGLLNQYMENDAAMVGTDVGILLHSEASLRLSTGWDILEPIF